MEYFLLARIGKIRIAINIKNIHFVIRNNGIVYLPDTPESIEGIISFRDKVIPVLNNKAVLKMQNDNSERKRIVLYEYEKDLLFGINVDEYLEILKVDKKNTKKMSIILKDEVIPIIDLKKLITEDEIEIAKKV